MPHNEFRYVAVKKFVAGHPPGSGEEVTYEIGDEVPAGEWGRAAGMMVESGKIVRQAFLVADPGDPVGAGFFGSPHPSTEKTVQEVNQETDPASRPDPRQGSEWPKDHGKGDYELSDGSHVYGKNKAIAAQEVLDAPQPLGADEGAPLGEPEGPVGEAGVEEESAVTEDQPEA